jgi:hypothetical protein
MLSSFFELDGQKDVQGKHPKLLQLVAVIGTDKTAGEYKEKIDMFFAYWDVKEG